MDNYINIEVGNSIISHFISHLMLFPTFKKRSFFWEILKSAPSLTG